jgi:uncharacterized protein (TIRG00374 family)
MKKYLKYIGLIILIIILINLDINNIIKLFSRINPWYLLIALLLNFPLLIIKSYRWNRLLHIQNIQYSISQSCLTYISSLYIGFITPGRLGEIVKAIYLKTEKNIPLSRGMSSVVVDRLFDLYLLILLSIIGIWRFEIFGYLSKYFYIIVCGFVFIPLLLLNKKFAFKIFSILHKSFIIQKMKKKYSEGFNDFYDGINQLKSIQLMFPILITLAGYLLFFLQCTFLLSAIKISINFISVSLFMSISNLISFIPISVSGLGTRDAALIYLFSLLKLKPEMAVSYSLLVFLTFFVFNGLIGAIAWFIKPVKLDNKYFNALKKINPKEKI